MQMLYIYKMRFILILCVFHGFGLNAQVSDSLDKIKIEKYLFEKHKAVKAYTTRARSNLLSMWENGPYKIDSPEISAALKTGWRVYGVCSYVHGIQSPAFKKTLFIDNRDSIFELVNDDVTLFNQALKQRGKAGDVKTMALAVMQILTSRWCIVVDFKKEMLAIVKKKGKYICKVEMGKGYRVETDPAYMWRVEFDAKLNCTKAWFRADLPPVP
jgi:hypothetical protein